MTVLLATVGGYVCGLMLLVAGLAHARDVGAFASVLRRQRLVPAGRVGVVARGVVALELALGVAALLALAVAQSEAAARLVLVVSAVLFATYAVYSAYLLSQDRSVPCGCSAADHPVNAAVVARAAGLSLAAVVAALAAGRILSPAGDEEFAIVVAASVAFSAILWALPAALHDPGTGRSPALVPTSEGNR